MAEMMTIKEASVLWDIFERRVNELCKNGRIRGAVKKAGTGYRRDFYGLYDFCLLS